MKIKTLRRIETEIDSEISFMSRRLRNLSKKADSLENAKIEGSNTIEAAQKSFMELNAAKFTIRGLVSEFNSTKGINRKTAEIAELEATKSFIEDVALSVNFAQTRESNYGSGVSHHVGLSEETEDSLRASVRGLTRKIQGLKDSCNGTNSQGDIQIPEKLLNLFKVYSLVD